MVYRATLKVEQGEVVDPDKLWPHLKGTQDIAETDWCILWGDGQQWDSVSKKDVFLEEADANTAAAEAKKAAKNGKKGKKGKKKTGHKRKGEKEGEGSSSKTVRTSSGSSRRVTAW